MPEIIKISNLEDTKEFAKNFSQKIKPLASYGLIGELGAGKTTFTKLLLKNFGFNNVDSPSYILCNEYENESYHFEHWDVYRLNETPEELLDPPSNKTIRLIEWANKFNDILLSLDYLIEFKIDNDFEKRIISIYSQSEVLNGNLKY